MVNSHPIYGADTEGSFYDSNVNEFNMKRLGTILDETKEATGGKVIRGVTSVYLYFGMYGASFAWHVEDMELYSINYLHHGAPKYWFAVPPEAATRFERLMRQQFPTYDRQCKGYHMGFNLGYNIAESTNFATDRWIDFGKNAVLCKCRSDMVEIDMTPFMQRYRRNDFEKWYSYWYLPKSTIVVDGMQCRILFWLVNLEKRRKDRHGDGGGALYTKRRRKTDEDYYDAWRCLRCRDRDDVAIRSRSCHLCELRGGALMPCRAGADISAFVHTICAIFNRRTVFNDAGSPTCCYTHPPPKQTSANGILKYLPRDYVLAMGETYEASRFQCDLCGNSREGLVRCSACDEDADPVLAHVTCARQAGFLFERRTYPQITAMVCDRHQTDEVGPLLDVNLGDVVIAWMDGGARVRQGRVDRLVLRTQLTIDFEDGSVSDNALAGDIVLCSCIRRNGCSDGKHQPGSRVKVRWNDGELYDGYYRCTLKAVEYTIVFRDGSSARLPRSDIYGADDAIPPEVRRRLRKYD
ncbi:JmjC domain protein [Oesophagostomum dentatum]|uniref:JmjC domain protein n=1 Tax=Oesophagostomum dentatum TaxID=61180 RepID=A0A0B1TKF2_OESDE|nr:JmjC domain protein [Oesophagostomum dentatum]